jgi:hypothetical protein
MLTGNQGTSIPGDNMGKNKELVCYPNPDQILTGLRSSTQKYRNHSTLRGYQGIINHSSSSSKHRCVQAYSYHAISIYYRIGRKNRCKVDQGHLPCCLLRKTSHSSNTCSWKSLNSGSGTEFPNTKHTIDQINTMQQTIIVYECKNRKSGEF